MSLIVISGVDGAGKTTQMNLLKEYINESKTPEKDYTTVKFPRYDYPSAKMVELYLRGEFGSNPGDVSPYLASTFYAIDRGISFQKEKWGEMYRKKKLILADRYYESNIIHQVAKQITPGMAITAVMAGVSTFIKYIETVELGYFKLPKPDCTIFLAMNPDTNWKLLQEREHGQGDIHERDREYFNCCQLVIKAMQIMQSNGNEFFDRNEFVFLNTTDYDDPTKLHTPEQIHTRIIDILKNRKLIA